MARHVARVNVAHMHGLTGESTRTSRTQFSLSFYAVYDVSQLMIVSGTD